MTPYSTPAADLLFVGVPEGLEKIKTFREFDDTFIHYKAKGLWRIPVLIPPGYSLLSAGTADGITEIEAGKVVEKETDKEGDWYFDYECDHKFFFKAATESFLSLLRSLHLNPSETVVLYKLKN